MVSSSAKLREVASGHGPIINDTDRTPRRRASSPLARIEEVHVANYHAYGYRRTWKALLRAGEHVGRDRVRRLMREHGIAERLVLSVRTVESHVYRAMTKLGVSDRRELR